MYFKTYMGTQIYKSTYGYSLRYTAYTGNMFKGADTLQGIKKLIKADLLQGIKNTIKEVK